MWKRNNSFNSSDVCSLFFCFFCCCCFFFILCTFLQGNIIQPFRCFWRTIHKWSFATSLFFVSFIYTIWNSIQQINCCAFAKMARFDPKKKNANKNWKLWNEWNVFSFVILNTHKIQKKKNIHSAQYEVKVAIDVKNFGTISNNGFRVSYNHLLGDKKNYVMSRKTNSQHLIDWLFSL